jgi:hypothetical protein
MDEWDQSQMWNGSMDWKWLFSPHNEHLIVTTRLITWLSILWNGGDFYQIQLLNFAVFGVFLLVTLVFFSSISDAFPRAAASAFMVFFLNTTNGENHFCAFSSIHVCLIGYILAAHLLFTAPPDFRRVLGACLFSVISMLSFVPGVILCTCLAFGFACYTWSERKQSKHAPVLGTVFFTFIGICVSLWLYNNPRASGHIPRVSVLSPEFRAYFVSLLSFGLGVDRIISFVGWGCFLLCLAPFVLLLSKASGFDSTNRRAFWASASIFVGLLATIAAISSGRASLGIITSKSSRYNELVLLVVPTCVVAWALFFSSKPNAKKYCLLFLWFLTFLSYRNNWSFEPYREEAARRQSGQECMRKYYFFRGDGNCPMLHPAPLAPKFELAKTLNKSFYREAIHP